MKNALLLSAACGLFAVALAGCGGGNNNNGISGTRTYAQTDRLARPVVNEVFATFANNRHLINDTDNPTDDKNQLANDIQSFMTSPAGRSPETTKAVVSVLVPDVMVADLSQNGTAAYLGSETGGATSKTGSKFGGRALTDDTVDISTNIIFGTTVSDLKLAPPDGKQMQSTPDSLGNPGGDHVGPHTDYTATFPYLGAPH